MRRLWVGLRWAVVFLAGAVLGGIVVGWFLREIGTYQRDLFRLSTVLWESEEALDQYAHGDPECAAAFLEHHSSVLRFYVETDTESVLGPGKRVYAVDLAVSYERLARLADAIGDAEAAAAWREKAIGMVRAGEVEGVPSYGRLVSFVDRMDQHFDGDRMVEEFGYLPLRSGETSAPGKIGPGAEHR